MPSEDQPRTWHPGPEPSSASGGHIAPEPALLDGTEAAEPTSTASKPDRKRSSNGGNRGGSSDAARSSVEGFDPLTAPLPSELEWDERPLFSGSSGSEWKDWGATLERARRADDERSRSTDPSRHSRAVSQSPRAAREVAFLEARQAALREEDARSTPEARAGAASQARTSDQQTARLRAAETASAGALREADARRVPQTEAQPRRRETGPKPAPQGGRRTRFAPRPVRRTLKHIHPLGVLKMSLFFYAIFLVVWLMVAAVIYWVLEGLGLFSSIEEFATAMEIPGWKDVNISLGTVERWALMIGAIFAVVATIVNVCLAFLYNLGSDLFGGIDMTFLERGEN